MQGNMGLGFVCVYVATQIIYISHYCTVFYKARGSGQWGIVLGSYTSRWVLLTQLVRVIPDMEQGRAGWHKR